MSGTEAARVRRARRGDDTAFESIDRDHARAVLALAPQTGDPAEAEDITRDTFLRLFGFLSGLHRDAPLRPWLNRVAANLAIDLRREYRHPGDKALLAVVDKIAAPTIMAEASAVARRLAPLARSLVWVHETKGWSHEAIAASTAPGRRPAPNAA